MSSATLPAVVAVAPNGAYRGRADHPALPLTPAELARTAARALEAGASMIHLHVRDRRGHHTLDPEAYRAAIAAIRRETGDRLLIQATSEAAGVYSPGEQMVAVRALRPEAVSLALREIVPDAAAEREAADFLAWLVREEVLPQYILYSADDLARWRDLLERSVIPASPGSLLFVLGRRDRAAEPPDLLPFLLEGKVGTPWMACAFGPGEIPCVAAAMAFGGHARVGFENSLLQTDGSLAADNAAAVERAAAAASVLGRPLASADDARGLLSSPPP